MYRIAKNKCLPYYKPLFNIKKRNFKKCGFLCYKNI